MLKFDMKTVKDCENESVNKICNGLATLSCLKGSDNALDCQEESQSSKGESSKKKAQSKIPRPEVSYSGFQEYDDYSIDSVGIVKSRSSKCLIHEKKTNKKNFLNHQKVPSRMSSRSCRSQRSSSISGCEKSSHQDLVDGTWKAERDKSWSYAGTYSDCSNCPVHSTAESVDTYVAASDPGPSSSNMSSTPPVLLSGVVSEKKNKNEGQTSTGKKRRFNSYMSLQEIQKGLKKGEVLEGVLRINQRNFEDAYISSPQGNLPDIYIGGIHDRNRAFHGDIVAFKIKSPEHWKINKEAVKEYESKNGRLFSSDQVDFKTFERDTACASSQNKLRKSNNSNFDNYAPELYLLKAADVHETSFNGGEKKLFESRGISHQPHTMEILAIESLEYQMEKFRIESGAVKVDGNITDDIKKKLDELKSNDKLHNENLSSIVLSPEQLLTNENGEFIESSLHDSFTDENEEFPAHAAVAPDELSGCDISTNSEAESTFSDYLQDRDFYYSQINPAKICDDAAEIIEKNYEDDAADIIEKNYEDDSAEILERKKIYCNSADIIEQDYDAHAADILEEIYGDPAEEIYGNAADIFEKNYDDDAADIIKKNYDDDAADIIETIYGDFQENCDHIDDQMPTKKKRRKRGGKKKNRANKVSSNSVSELPVDEKSNDSKDIKIANKQTKRDKKKNFKGVMDKCESKLKNIGSEDKNQGESLKKEASKSDSLNLKVKMSPKHSFNDNVKNGEDCRNVHSKMNNKNKLWNEEIDAKKMARKENDIKIFNKKTKKDKKKSVKDVMDKCESELKNIESKDEVKVKDNVENEDDCKNAHPKMNGENKNGNEEIKAKKRAKRARKKKYLYNNTNGENNKNSEKQHSFHEKNEKRNSAAKKDEAAAEYQYTVFQLLNHPCANKFVQRTAEVVGILEKKHSRVAVGCLSKVFNEDKSYVLMSPDDSRVPRILIPVSDCPSDFISRPKDYKDTIFAAKIDVWPETSMFSFGRILKIFGSKGDINAETEAILIENNVDSSEFPNHILKNLPLSDWKMPESELLNRRDFRDECIFTIDPSTARDLDDAVGCSYIGDGMYKVSVHIADVSYFLTEESDLDKVARSRATSVYLVQKVIPMLPRVLCEKLCSLNPGEDKLTFSIEWNMTEDGEILDEWFGRGIINSCVKMSYDHAQDLITTDESSDLIDRLPRIDSKFNLSTVHTAVRNLNMIAKKLRSQRFESGSLRLDQVKLKFDLDEQSGLPFGYSCYEQKDSNKLIEEFMLLANIAVAHFIYKTYPKLSFLRRHPEPNDLTISKITEMCKAHNVVVDDSSSKSLQESLTTIQKTDSTVKAMYLALSNLYSKPMNCAKYFCSSIFDDQIYFRHYGLNVPLYTHFTSPIRRYADIIVHRQLASALRIDEPPKMTFKQLQNQAEICNDKKLNAKRASEMSSELFLNMFISKCGPIKEKGIVIGIMDHSFDALLLNLGSIKRVYCNRMNLKSYSFEKTGSVSTLTLVHNNEDVKSIDNDANDVTQIIKMFELVDLKLFRTDKELKFKAIVIPT